MGFFLFSVIFLLKTVSTSGINSIAKGFVLFLNSYKCVWEVKCGFPFQGVVFVIDTESCNSNSSLLYSLFTCLVILWPNHLKNFSLCMVFGNDLLLLKKKKICEDVSQRNYCT